MKILITNKIAIANAPQQVKSTIKNSLTIKNPLYYKLINMGRIKALYNVPEFFKYYTEIGNVLIVGRGVEKRLFKYLKKENYKYEVKRQVCKTKAKEKFNQRFRPRKYQEGNVDSISKHKNGVIRLGTGYGKTPISCALIGKLKGTTLYIVPRTHLLKQFVEEFTKIQGFKPSVIQGNKTEVGEVTVATIQTLQQRPEITEKIKNKFNVVIVDECHTFITDKRLNIIQQFNPEYLYGLTATPRRTDKQGEAIFHTFGGIIIDKDLPRKAPAIQGVYSNLPIQMNEYAAMIDEQIRNSTRNELIADLVKAELKDGRKIMILTKRIEHYKLIKNLLSCDGIYMISSSEKQEERLRIMGELRKGKKDFNIILGTYSMLSHGTDIPALDTLVFAGDLRSDVLAEQSAGRILRLFGDKKDPKIIDIIDNQNHILFNQARERLGFYKRQRWL